MRKNIYKYIVGFLFLTALIVLSIANPKQSMRSYDSIIIDSVKIHNDTTKIINADYELTKVEYEEFLKVNDEHNKMLKSLFISDLDDDLLITIDSIRKIETKNYLKFIQEKRKNVFEKKNRKIFDGIILSEKRKATIEKLSNSTPNIWLIILIIISAGLLGGFAKTRFKDLEEIRTLLSQTINEAERLESAISKKLGETPNNLKDRVNELNNITAKLDSNINNEEERRNLLANIVFGIIASSLSFLALNFADSKILDFSGFKEYFILWGWCVLGALFAKSWIKALYEKISK